MSTPVWRKSTHSGAQEGACVEVARLAGAIGVRDSKRPEAACLVLAGGAFADLLVRVKRDELTR